MNTVLLGGGDIQEAAAKAAESVAFARRSGMPAAIVQSLNALALTLVEHEPARAKALLQESIELSSTLSEENSIDILSSCLVAGRLRDWDLTLALTGRSMYLYRWTMAPLTAATCLAECARAFVDDRPEVAGVLQGAAYAAFRRASPATNGTRRHDTKPVGPNANFVLAALRETGDLAATVQASADASFVPRGAAMSTDEAISYALANIGPKLITGPVTLA